VCPDFCLVRSSVDVCRSRQRKMQLAPSSSVCNIFLSPARHIRVPAIHFAPSFRQNKKHLMQNKTRAQKVHIWVQVHACFRRMLLQKYRGRKRASQVFLERQQMIVHSSHEVSKNAGLILAHSHPSSDPPGNLAGTTFAF
jgi:hypothetical protein